MSWSGHWRGNKWVEGLAPPEPPVPPNGQAWCSSKLCDRVRPYDVLPATPSCGIPPFAFCAHCGDQVQVKFEEEGAA